MVVDEHHCAAVRLTDRAGDGPVAVAVLHRIRRQIFDRAPQGLGYR